MISPIYIALPSALYAFLAHDVDSATFPLTFMLAAKLDISNESI